MYRKLSLLRTPIATLVSAMPALPEHTVQIQSAARSFSREKLLPNSLAWDHASHFPKDEVIEAAKLGFLGLYVPEQFGGAGLDRLSSAVVFEELAYGDVATSAYMSVHNMVVFLVSLGATEDPSQKIQNSAGKAFLKDVVQKMVDGTWLGSYCLTEPGSGSDSAAMKTIAKEQNGQWVINGEKVFISGGSVSDIYLVMTKTGEKEVTAFIVPKGAKGLTFGKPEKKMGWNSSTTTTVSFDNVSVPKENMVGNRGEGFKLAMQGLNGGRINIAACSLGGAALAIDKALEYVKTRSQFGKHLIEFQNTQFVLAKNLARLANSRVLVYEAAKALDSDSPEKIVWAAMAKLMATDECYFAADECLQMFGGYGYLKDYGMEKIVRDLRVHRILEGTNEIMKLIISRNMVK